MSHGSENRRTKALRLSALYGYGASSEMVRKRVASRSRPRLLLATAGASHFSSKKLNQEELLRQQNQKSLHEEILERAQTAAVRHEKRWNFGVKLPEKVLHPVPPAMVEDTTVVFHDAPHTWRSPALQKRVNPLGEKSPYTREAMQRRPSTHSWATQRKPHNFNPATVPKQPRDEFLERVFYEETRADLEKQKRLRALKQKFEKDESTQGRNAGLYTTLSAPPPDALASKAERAKRPIKIWGHFTAMLKPKDDGAHEKMSSRDAELKSIWKWHEARHFLGKIRRAQRPRGGMDNIQILLGQFKAGMREHGITESSSWVVNRDLFAKIILSKYSELEPRSANRLYSSLDLKYTDQVDFRRVVACLVIVQFRQSPAMTVLARLFDIFSGLRAPGGFASIGAGEGGGGGTVPIDDICMILTTCCPDPKSEVFLWETAQVGLRSKHPENHKYSYDDLEEFLEREPKMYNTFCAYFDKVKRELLNRNPNGY